MRAYSDKSFWKDFEGDDYFYEDPEREHHFFDASQVSETRIGG